MKTLNLYFVIILINLFTLKTTAQNRKNKFKAIQISTNVLCNNIPANRYSLVMFKDGVQLDSLFNSESETIDAILQLNQIYAIKIAKAGFKDITVVINTTIPDGFTQLSHKCQKLNINMPELIFDNGNKEKVIVELVMDKTLGMLVRKSDLFDSKFSDTTSGLGNFPQNSN